MIRIKVHVEKTVENLLEKAKTINANSAQSNFYKPLPVTPARKAIEETAPLLEKTDSQQNRKGKCCSII